MSKSTAIHLGVLAVGIFLITGLYLFQQNVTSAVFAMTTLVIGHLLVIRVVLYIGRKRVARLLEKLTRVLDRLGI